MLSYPVQSISEVKKKKNSIEYKSIAFVPILIEKILNREMKLLKRC